MSSSGQPQGGSMKTISDSKLVTFALGKQQKSRFQKAREEKEAKKRQDEQEAAREYDSFVASFVDEEGSSKVFIRGGQQVNSAVTDGVGIAPGAIYKPERNTRSDNNNINSEVPRSAASSSSSAAATGKSSRQIDDFLSELISKHEHRDHRSDGSSAEEGGRGRSTGPPAFVPDEVRGSFDDGDPNTTNLYLGNLAPSTTEEHIMDLFGKFGAINSVKVMWPRTEEERVRKRNCGFVSFKRRCDAEEALLELQDAELEEYRMVICWGKAVRISSTPFTLPGSNRSAPTAAPSPASLPAAAVAAPPPPLHLQSIAAVTPSAFPPRPPPPPFPSPTPVAASSAGPVLPPSAVLAPTTTISDSASSSVQDRYNNSSSSSSNYVGAPVEALAQNGDFSGMSVDAFMESVAAAASLPPPPPPSVLLPPCLPTADDHNTVQVSVPSNSATRALIDLVAKYTAADGHAFETRLKIREESNPDYAFLFDDAAEDGIYYRWRTYANVWGDSARKWSVAAAQWSVGGLVFVPPELERGGEGSSSPHEEEVSSRGGDSSDDRIPVTGSSRHSQRRSGSPSTGASAAHRRKRSRSRSTSRERERDRGREREREKDRGRDRDRERGRERDRERERVQYAGMTGAQIERARTKERMDKLAKLSKEDYREWKSKLRSLSLERLSIKEAMGFAFDKIESSEEIVHMIRDRLVLPSNYAAVKVAGLYLLSDILHNAGAPIKHAAGYRTLVQSVLPAVLDDLRDSMRKATGRMSAYHIEDRVKSLFAAWTEWSIFPATYLTGLQATFHMSEADCLQLREHMVHSAAAAAGHHSADDDIDGLPMDLPPPQDLDALRKKARLSGVAFHEQSSATEIEFRLKVFHSYSSSQSQSHCLAPSDQAFSSSAGPRGGAASTKSKLTNLEQLLHYEHEQDDDDDHADGTDCNIDGVPYNEDIDGVPYNEDIDGVPYNEDIDGVPYSEDIDGVPYSEDIDGVPYNEDIDGVPYSEEEADLEARPPLPGVHSGSDRSRQRAFEEQLLRLRDQLEASGQHSDQQVMQILQQTRERESGGCS